MKIYIITFGCLHDGYSNIGAWQSLEDARIKAIELVTAEKDEDGWPNDYKGAIEETPNKWVKGNEYVEIEEFELI